MPPAIIGALIAAAATATTTGLEIAGVGKPSTSAPKVPTGPSPLTTQQNQQQQAAVSQQLPTLQSLTGGSLSPEYAAQFGALQSGVGNDPQATGNIQAAIDKFFGLSAGGNSGLTTSGSGSGGGGGGPFADILARFQGSGGGSGGGNNDFRGLAG